MVYCYHHLPDNRPMSSTSSQKTPNPQGKGAVPVLSDWHQFRPREIRNKAQQQLLADYVISLLVLSAEFHFKPVVGQDYHLYHRRGGWHLSLIEPERWDRERAGDYLGRCRLHPDMTWSIETGPATRPAGSLHDALQRFVDDVTAHVVETDEDHLLPWYERNLPWYRRLAASGLARSLAASPGFNTRELRRQLATQAPIQFLEQR